MRGKPTPVVNIIHVAPFVYVWDSLYLSDNNRDNSKDPGKTDE